MTEPEDHGVVTQRPRARISWVWAIPVLAAAAAAWLFWTDWQSNGPEIQIRFESAPGVEPNKTLVIYRGVSAGIVTRVQLDSGLKEVLVTARLKAFAAGLARQKTEFWVDQPVVSLEQTSGLDSIIQGNSIQARLGEGPVATKFEGLNKPPLTPLADPSEVVTLHAQDIAFLERGAPVYFHGVAVGSVQQKSLDQDGRPFLSIVIDAKYNQIIRSNTRFWHVAAATLNAGSGVLKLDVAGIKALLQGAVAFDSFGPAGDPVKNGTNFELYPSELAAQCIAPPFTISFDSGRGLAANETRICYRGVPVGIILEIRPVPANESVETVVRLEPSYDYLRTAGAAFSVVRPHASLSGVSGLDTIVTGAYVNLEPGPPGKPADSFAGTTPEDEDSPGLQPGAGGLEIALRAKGIPVLEKGAPVYYRGVIVGKVERKTLDTDNVPILHVTVAKEFEQAVRTNARFWSIPAAAVTAGPGTMKFSVEGIRALLQGGVAFDVFGTPGDPAKYGAQFDLFGSDSAARAASSPLRISFGKGQGLLAGQTQLRYLGVPVGLVETVTAEKGKVQVVAHLDPGYDFLRARGSVFYLVQTRFSIKEITGLETLLSGVYIDCEPAPGGELAQDFTGYTRELDLPLNEHGRLEIVLTAPSCHVGIDAPVYYRGLRVGKVDKKLLSPDGRDVQLVVLIERTYAPLVRENSQFWDTSGAKITLGFISIKMHSEALDALSAGALDFATPNNAQMGPPAKSGQIFILHPVPGWGWKQWNPSIPLNHTEETIIGE